MLLVVLCLAKFMSGLDEFVVNVALHPLGNALGEESLTSLSWVLNGYAIVFAAVLVPAGRLADRYGTKRAFLVGLALFSLGSLGCGLSTNLWLLVGLRCVQAAGAAALVPTSLGLVLTALPAERVSRSVQLWSIAGSLGAAIGPALGGLVVQVSWRWVFIVNVPIGLVAFAATVALAPGTRARPPASLPDLAGGGLLMVGVGALSLALVEGPSWGWGDRRVAVAVSVAVVALAGCLLRSTRVAVPVVDLALFRRPAFGWANTANLALWLAFGIQLLGLVLWLQREPGASAVRTGLAMVPGPVMVSVTALGLRRCIAALPAGAVAGAGCLLVGGGGVLIGSSLTSHGRYLTEVLPGWLIMGVGVGLAMPTLVATATAGLLPNEASTGAAVVQTGSQIGSVLGVAALVVVLGSERVIGATVGDFVRSWWCAGGFSLVAALACLPLLRRPVSDQTADVAG